MIYLKYIKKQLFCVFFYLYLLLPNKHQVYFSFDILIIGSEGDLNPKCLHWKLQLSYKTLSTNFVFLGSNSILIIYIILIIK